MEDVAPDASLSKIVPLIDLSQAPGGHLAWDRPLWFVLAWSVAELVFISNPGQISSAVQVRVRVLRAFGGTIGSGVTFRARTRVKFLWKLTIGDRSWIGEGVWFHNQAEIVIGSDVVVSQETFLTTGSHRHPKDVRLITRRILIEDRAWITSRCLVLGGSHVGRSALARPRTVLQGDIGSNCIVSGTDCRVVGTRFEA